MGGQESLQEFESTLVHNQGKADSAPKLGSALVAHARFVEDRVLLRSPAWRPAQRWQLVKPLPLPGRAISVSVVIALECLCCVSLAWVLRNVYKPLNIEFQNCC